MPKETKSKKAAGYSAEDAPRAPAPAKKKEESDSESDDGSGSGSGSDDGEAAPQEKQEPRFKNLAEQKAHEEELKKQALADEATIKRLEEIRIRREKQRLEREAAEKAAGEEEKQRKEAAEKAEQERQKALSERPKLDVPGPKEVKDSLTKLQGCASDAFLQKHGLKGATGNKLAKIKYGDFKKIFDDFQESAPLEELHKYKGT
eukprot:gnl/TRDRNA2_/TRDRNA2_195216_c0_seq1.p1 gnl/TRDRNA2_/TRDRNA2_195216_c0~~gnl/TRDRNA2_/TRDRNA2_195216_c0_seq1.p1  ORF type:complete len:204 (-),score=80.09 gnl/TRDRNA2_/TRDRNA2_195216_c0_seq1:30-641(-)